MPTFPSPNANPEGVGTVHIVHGEVDPPVEGESSVALCTIQPDKEKAIKRFVWHFRQMDRRVLDVTDVDAPDDPEAFIREQARDESPLVAEHVLKETARCVHQTADREQ